MTVNAGLRRRQPLAPDQLRQADRERHLVVDGRSYKRRKRVGAIRNHASPATGAAASGGDWYRGLMDEVSIKLG